MKPPAIWFAFATLVCNSGVAQKIPMPEVAQKSAEWTTLTAPGAAPFHLKAEISIKQMPKAQGVIEEYWVSPTKWRRTISVPTFAQTTIVNGDSYYEKNEHASSPVEYFPVGLQVLAQALVQPIPDGLLQGLKTSKVKMDFYGGKLSNTNICDGDMVKTGARGAQNSLWLSVCFAGNPPIIRSITEPFYELKLEDQQPFGKLMVARHLVVGEDWSMTWEAKVSDLSELTTPDDSLFVAPENTPKESRFQAMVAQEEVFRGVFKNVPEPAWPAVSHGDLSGVITMYVSIDREGYVAEAWPATGGASAEIAEAASKHVGGLVFPRKAEDKRFLQLETMLTFAYKTQRAASVPDSSGAKQ